MSKKLRDNGFDVTIITSYAHSHYKPKKYGEKIIYLYAPNVTLVFRTWVLLRTCWWLLQNANREDIIILSPAGLLISPLLWLLHMRNIHLDIRTLPLKENLSLKRTVDTWIFWKLTLGKLMQFAKGYSFITERLKQAVEQEFHTKVDNYVIWQSGVNTSEFKPPRIRYNETPEKLFFLFYHGSIYQSRGVSCVIEALQYLEPRYSKIVRFIVVGPDTGQVKLSDIVKSKGLSDSVILKGYVPHERIAEEIGEADCCICPLPDLPEWNVSSPLKVMEYLASGKPVILTPIPAHRDVFVGQKFVVWTKGYDPINISKAIQYAYDNRVSLRKSAGKAPKYIEKYFDWGIQAKRLAKYLWAL